MWFLFALLAHAEDRIGDIGEKPVGELPYTGIRCAFPGSRWSRADIDARVKQVMPRVRSCYQHTVPKKKLFRKPADFTPLAGKVTMRFSIGIDGVVAAQVKSSDVGEGPVVEEFHTCLAGALERMEFEPSRSLTWVSYPFVFSAE